MDKTYEVEFCWLTVLPASIISDGKKVPITMTTSGKKVAKVKGNTVPNVLDRLKGTDTKLISCINKIKEC